MKQIIKLKESDLRKLVMETTAKLLNPDYSWHEFDQDAFDVEGDEKQSQIDASWDALNTKSYLSNPEWDRDENYRDNGIDGYYGLLSQGYDKHTKTEDLPSDIMYGQHKRGSTTKSVEADKNNWFAAPNDEYFDDGMPPIIGQEPLRNGKFATRNPDNGTYKDDLLNTPYPLDEAINRAIRKTIKKHVR